MQYKKIVRALKENNATALFSRQQLSFTINRKDKRVIVNTEEIFTTRFLKTVLQICEDYDTLVYIRKDGQMIIHPN